jgi:hypothetical protein
MRTVISLNIKELEAIVEAAKAQKYKIFESNTQQLPFWLFLILRCYEKKQ